MNSMQTQESRKYTAHRLLKRRIERNGIVQRNIQFKRLDERRIIKCAVCFPKARRPRRFRPVLNKTASVLRQRNTLATCTITQRFHCFVIEIQGQLGHRTLLTTTSIEPSILASILVRKERQGRVFLAAMRSRSIKAKGKRQSNRKESPCSMAHRPLEQRGCQGDKPSLAAPRLR